MKAQFIANHDKQGQAAHRWYRSIIPALMPSMPADKRDFNEYSNPTFVVSDCELVNFAPVVILNSFVMSLVPCLQMKNKNIEDQKGVISKIK